MLIGITGYKGAGKSLLAAAITSHRPNNSVVLRFASVLKMMCSVVLQSAGMSVADAYQCTDGSRKEEPLAIWRGHSTRYAMQTLGTEWGRALIGNDFWIHLWSLAANAQLIAGRTVVIDDVRFPNEATAVKDAGGKLVRVERPGRSMTDVHESERHVSTLPADDVWYNVGSHDDALAGAWGFAQRLIAGVPTADTPAN